MERESAATAACCGFSCAPLAPLCCGQCGRLLALRSTSPVAFAVAVFLCLLAAALLPLGAVLAPSDTYDARVDLSRSSDVFDFNEKVAGWPAAPRALLASNATGVQISNLGVLALAPVTAPESVRVGNSGDGLSYSPSDAARFVGSSASGAPFPAKSGFGDSFLRLWRGVLRGTATRRAAWAHRPGCLRQGAVVGHVAGPDLRVHREQHKRPMPLHVHHVHQLLPDSSGVHCR